MRHNDQNFQSVNGDKAYGDLNENSKENDKFIIYDSALAISDSIFPILSALSKCILQLFLESM